MVGGLPDWTRLWCVLRQNHLRYWNSPEDIGKKDLVYQCDLTKVIGSSTLVYWLRIAIHCEMSLPLVNDSRACSPVVYSTPQCSVAEGQQQ